MSIGVLDKIQISLGLLQPCGSITESQTFTKEEFSRKELQITQQLEEIGILCSELFPSSKKIRFCYNQYSEGFTINNKGLFFDCDYDLGQIDKGKIHPDLHKMTPIDKSCLQCTLLPLCMGGCKHFDKCPPYKFNFAERLEYTMKKLLKNEITSN